MTKLFTYAFLIQCLFMNFLLANNGNAQVKSIEEVMVQLRFQEEPIEVVFSKIEKASGFSFVYTNRDIRNLPKVSSEGKSQSLYDLLKEVAIQARLEFKQVNHSILVHKSNRKNSPEPVIVVIQDVTITGTVTDASGNPIPGVTVSVPGTGTGTATDMDGRYSLSVPEGSSVVFSFIGFESQQVTVGNQTVINITLVEDMASLDEVVVIGYGTIKKREVTGSIGSLVMDEDLSRPVGNFGQAMYGKIAGVQILQGSGAPGTSASIQIRGANSISAGSQPLIVIDGVQLPGYDLNSISSADIESIEVLKDAASSSIYGSRGANGVILVTTRSGSSGEHKFQINYTSSLQQLIKKIDVMNAAEYAQASIDAAQNGWISIGGDPNAPNTIAARGNYLYTWPTAFDNPESLPYDTDWQDVVYRTAPMHDLNLRLTGGDQKTNYHISAGYLSQTGIMITSDYQKLNFNLKLDSKIKDWFSLGGFVNALYDSGNEPDDYTSIGAVQYPAIYPVWGEDGYLGGPQNTPGFENWFAILFRPNSGHPYYNTKRRFENTNLKTFANLYAEFSLLEGLKFRTSLNTYISREDSKDFYAGDHLLGPNNYTTVRTVSTMNRYMKYTWENLLTYSKIFGDHSINVLGGYEFNALNYYYLNGERRDYDSDDFPYLAAGETIYQTTDNASENRLISYFGRFHYNYLEKYFLTATYRRDGSSRFGPDSKWGNFPSLSLAWNISEEPFMEALHIVYNLKLRGSYGFTGNDNFSDYRWISQMNQAKVAIGDNLVTSYYPSTVENPDLAWERTKQLNLGVDIGLMNNRFTLEADVYNTNSDGLLLSVPVPSTSGYSSIFSNIGQVDNRGLELNLISRNLTGEFTWMTHVAYSTNRSKVVSLGPNDSPMFYNLNGGMQNVNMVGEPLYSFYAYQYDGVYMNQAEIDADPTAYEGATPGDGRYKDVNGDGMLNASDRTIIGKNTPDFVYGMTNSFTYKGFDFSFLLQGLVGMDIYDVNFRRSMRYHEGRNYYGLMNNRWRSEEDPGDGYVYKINTTLDNYETVASSFWLVDGTYLRLKDITLGYTLPKKLLEKIGLTKARIFFNGVNLFTLTDAPVNDPENFNGNATTMVRESHSPYPSSKIFSFGINIDL